MTASGAWMQYHSFTNSVSNCQVVPQECRYFLTELILAVIIILGCLSDLTVSDNISVGHVTDFLMKWYFLGSNANAVCFS